MKIALLVLMFGALPLSVVAQPAAGPSQHPFVGHWKADLSKSEPVDSQIQGISLEVAIVADTVSFALKVIDASGQEVGLGTTTFQTDGKEHPHDDLTPGTVVVAKWNGSDILETVQTRKDGQVVRVTYEISSNRRTLTTRTSDNLGKQVIVFDRQ
jgi:hypothetical protein